MLYITFKLSRKFATTVRSVPVRALEWYAAGSGFRAQWSHFFYWHCISFSLKLG